MISYIVQSDRKGSITIMEVEVAIISAVEDPSVMWLPQGEYRARVLHPTSLHDPDLGPPVWYSHVFYPTVEQATEAAICLIKQQFEFSKRKLGTDFTADDIKQRALEIAVIYLP